MLFKFSFFNKKNIFINKDKIKNQLVFRKTLKNIFWFVLGAGIGFFFFVSFLTIFYQKTHKEQVYTGVFVDGRDFSGKSKTNVKNHFAKKNQSIVKHTFELRTPTNIATISAKQIEFGYDDDLLAEQAFSIGRSDNQISNLNIIIKAYFNQIHLPAAYRYSENKLDKLLVPLKKGTEIQPVNALFTFENGKVSAFSLSRDGRVVDITKLKVQLYSELIKTTTYAKASRVIIQVPIKVVKPAVTNENVNSLGIRELIGEGTSLFAHSIENRIYNIKLAAGRLNGVLIAPGEVFSFNKALGDVSAFTGYKQAYVIENGRTVLGDGGGVCQVSTTLFRAALSAGLPIAERSAHAYRVSYYEQDSGPGVDAAVYSPSVDLKFKNDTGSHILIQSYADLDNLRLNFYLYGAKDGREVVIGQPVILSTAPAPPPIYQDDPALQKGVEKQVDFSAAGARVFFTRTVKKDDKVILNDKFSSNYRPWQAIFLKGTKE